MQRGTKQTANQSKAGESSKTLFPHKKSSNPFDSDPEDESKLPETLDPDAREFLDYAAQVVQKDEQVAKRKADGVDELLEFLSQSKNEQESESETDAEVKMSEAPRFTREGFSHPPHYQLVGDFHPLEIDDSKDDELVEVEDAFEAAYNKVTNALFLHAGALHYADFILLMKATKNLLQFKYPWLKSRSKPVSLFEDEEQKKFKCVMSSEQQKEYAEKEYDLQLERLNRAQQLTRKYQAALKGEKEANTRLQFDFSAQPCEEDQQYYKEGEKRYLAWLKTIQDFDAYTTSAAFEMKGGRLTAKPTLFEMKENADDKCSTSTSFAMKQLMNAEEKLQLWSEEKPPVKLKDFLKLDQGTRKENAQSQNVNPEPNYRTYNSYKAAKEVYGFYYRGVTFLYKRVSEKLGQNHTTSRKKNGHSPH